MTPLPRAEAIRRIEQLRDAVADYDKAREELRAAAMRNSWLVLGTDHPDAIGSREMDRLLRPGRERNETNRAAYQFIRWGLEHREQMRVILGYDPLDREGVAVTPTPATPPANRGA